MTEEELALALERLIDGDLSDEESRRLAERLAPDSEEGRALRDDLEMAGLIGVGLDDSGSRFLASLRERIKAEDGAEEFRADAARRRAAAHSRKRSRARITMLSRPPVSLPWLALAAAALIGLGLTLGTSMWPHDEGGDRAVRRAPDSPGPPVARVVAFSGDAVVLRVDGEVRVALNAAEGLSLRSTDHIDTRSGSVQWRFDAEDTTIALESGASASLTVEGARKRVRLERGRLLASVAPQRDGAAMALVTPNARARVIGTKFALESGDDGTRLEVDEGSVELTRDADGASVVVEDGHYAVAGRSGALVARRVAPRQPEAPPRPAGPSVVSFSLVVADGGRAVRGWEAIVRDATIDLASLPTRRLTIFARTDPAEVNRVRFDFDGRIGVQFQASPPYAATRSDGKTRFEPLPLTPGVHTITATPFTGHGAQQRAGSPLSVTLTVTDTANR